jgi:RimJ/RimL family protein N-acetyltransferase
MSGRYCRLEPQDVERHAQGLFDAFAEDDGRMWTYLAWGPFSSAAALSAMLGYTAGAFQPFTVLDLSGAPLGSASYMRHDVGSGAIEVGAVMYAPRLQRTAAATEAMYLMMRRVFEEEGYRRYEWKCDALNAPSRAAALRLGFQFEGVFRQAMVYKKRARDTAWFSILDSEWPALKQAFEAWLDPANFDAAGVQKRTLADFRRT